MVEMHADSPEAFYGLDRNPFRKAPDPEHLHPAPAVEEALARLEYAALEREIAVLTGDIGVGKTTLTRHLVDRLGEEVQIVWIMNPRLTPNQFLRQLAMRLEISPLPRDRVAMLDAIHEAVVAAWAAGRPVVLLIDEAQMLPFPDTFEELRLLTNVQGDGENLLAVLLVGQPELEERLVHPRMAPLNQRVGVRFHLGPLAADETAAYLESRAASAGRTRPLFDDAATARLAAASRGVPRVLNNLCNHALLAGFVAGCDPIDLATVDTVVADLGLGG